MGGADIGHQCRRDRQATRHDPAKGPGGIQHPELCCGSQHAVGQGATKQADHEHPLASDAIRKPAPKGPEQAGAETVNRDDHGYIHFIAPEDGCHERKNGYHQAEADEINDDDGENQPLWAKTPGRRGHDSVHR